MSVRSEEPDPLLGTVLDERFRLQEHIADGGLAAVYRGTDVRQPGPVAIKIVHALYAGLPWVRQRFAREATLAARIGQRVGAASRGQGQLSGTDRTWLALDFVGGATLRERLRRGGASVKLRPVEAAGIAVGLLARLQVLHAEGHVHRDLRPANVILAGAGSVRLIDLHGAVPIGALPGPDEPELPQGHPAYAAPEQWRDDVAAEPRADLYAVGAILFEALCGRRPFTGDVPALIDAHEKRTPPRPRAFAATASEELEKVLLKALAKSPAERWTSARAMREALEATPERPILSE